MKIKNILILTLPLIGVLGVFNDHLSKSRVAWQEYSYPKENFSILMPLPPQKDEKFLKGYSGPKGDSGSAVTINFTAMTGSFIWERKGFGVGYVLAEKSIFNLNEPVETLEGIKKSFLRSVKGILVNEKKLDYKGKPSLEIIFKVPFDSGKPRTLGVTRIILASDHSYYQTQVYYFPFLKPVGKINYDEVYKFLDSFQLNSSVINSA